MSTNLVRFPAKHLSFSLFDDVLSDKPEPERLNVYYNPQNFNQSFSKKITRTQTATAFLEEHWGEELDTISCNNSTGSFMLAQPTESRFIGHEGLTTHARKYTEAYQNFQYLLDLYRNNGLVYDLNTGMSVRMGYIVLYFDEGTYFGYFESFNVNENADSPFRFTFDFTFKVESSDIK